MKKSTLLIVLSVLCAMLLTGCFCKHEAWKNADCENPITCAQCGKTQGEPLGHKWADATCTEPKTCAACGKTEGEALGHTWTDADCETPKTCQTCALTEGEALGHTWEDATTEAPKTCTACAKTEGERIITDPRFTTAACKPFFGKWVLSKEFTGDMMDMEGFTGSLTMNIYMDFSNDGKLTMTSEADGVEAFNQALTQYMADAFYAEMAAQGINKAAADAVMLGEYGMTTEEYFAFVVKSIDFSAMLAIFNEEGVYYVNGDTLYTADEWKKDMNALPYKFQGETLILEDLMDKLDVTEGGFTRVPDSES